MQHGMFIGLETYADATATGRRHACSYWTYFTFTIIKPHYETASIHNRRKLDMYARMHTNHAPRHHKGRSQYLLAWALAEHAMKPWLHPRVSLERHSTNFSEALFFGH
jgi:hypothetical protein